MDGNLYEVVNERWSFQICRDTAQAESSESDVEVAILDSAPRRGKGFGKSCSFLLQLLRSP